MQEISKGALPYLYGGKPPGCKNCKSSEFVSKFCQYGMPGHGQCDKGQIYYLVQQFLDREFHEVLQFTPCDLWPLLKGRTLYFSGDSQTQVAHYQDPCGLRAPAHSSLIHAVMRSCTKGATLRRKGIDTLVRAKAPSPVQEQTCF